MGNEVGWWDDVEVKKKQNGHLFIILPPFCSQFSLSLSLSLSRSSIIKNERASHRSSLSLVHGCSFSFFSFYLFLLDFFSKLPFIPSPVFLSFLSNVTFKLCLDPIDRNYRKEHSDQGRNRNKRGA